MSREGLHDVPPSAAGPSTAGENAAGQRVKSRAQVQVPAPGSEDSNEDGNHMPQTRNLLALGKER